METYNEFHQHSPFRVYYAIGEDDQQTGANAANRRKKELNGKTEPSHSLFGLVGETATATGWSISYIMEHVNYLMLIMMRIDAPHYVDGETLKARRHNKMIKINGQRRNAISASQLEAFND